MNGLHGPERSCRSKKKNFSLLLKTHFRSVQRQSSLLCQKSVILLFHTVWKKLNVILSETVKQTKNFWQDSKPDAQGKTVLMGKSTGAKNWFSGQRKMVSYRVIVCFNRVKFMSWWITFLCSYHRFDFPFQLRMKTTINADNETDSWQLSNRLKRVV